MYLKMKNSHFSEGRFITRIIYKGYRERCHSKEQCARLDRSSSKGVPWYPAQSRYWDNGLFVPQMFFHNAHCWTTRALSSHALGNMTNICHVFPFHPVPRGRSLCSHEEGELITSYTYICTHTYAPRHMHTYAPMKSLPGTHCFILFFVSKEKS